jgi:hypothetical protein
MAQVNVYVPDDLKTRLDAAELPLSQLARSAWERELAREEEAAEMNEIKIDAVDDDGTDIDLRFTGTELRNSGVYRTEDGGAVLVDEKGRYSSWTTGEIDADEETFSDGVYETLRSWGTEEQFGDVLAAFGVKPIVRL